MSISETSSPALARDTRPPVPLVRSLDRNGAFEQACTGLMQQVQRDVRPDVLIGIRTGGLVVAEAMSRSDPGRPIVLPLTSRRAATGAKSRNKLLPWVLKNLPRSVSDRLRVLELRLLSSRRRRKQGQQHVDPREADVIRQYLADLPPHCSAVVVDDAVDSGVTLAAVLHLLRSTCRTDIRFCSAVITVTLDNPLVEPEYVLYRGVPCRFPWSFDAAR